MKKYFGLTNQWHKSYDDNYKIDRKLRKCEVERVKEREREKTEKRESE